jgi:hypothetical protein
MELLSFFSTVVNLLALAASVWLGFYIVTRSPRSFLSWLAALTLWSLSSYFLHNSIAVNLPGATVLPWLRQVVIVVLPLWLHLTFLLRNERTPLSPLSLFSLILSYGVAGVLILIGVFTQGLLSDASAGPAVYTSGRLAGPLYFVFILFLIVVGAISILNLSRGLIHARDSTLRRRYTSLLVATSFLGAGALYTSLGIWLRLDLPTFPGDAAMGTGVILLGFAVARYNALLEGRRIERDFNYTLLAVGSLSFFYVAVTLFFYLGGQISFLTLILTIVGTLSFNSLYDGVRVALDRLFYQGQFQRLRANLRALAHEAGTGQRLPEQLQAILTALCRALRIQTGFVALRSDDAFVVAATFEANPVGQAFPLPSLTATEIIGLVRPERKGLERMALLVPLYNGDLQIGALVLGEKEANQPYSEQDFELFDDLAEIAGVIHLLRTQEETVQRINVMVDEYRSRERTLQLQVQELLAESRKEPEPAAAAEIDAGLESQVEDGLRRLYDFSYLGEHALAKLRVVYTHLGKERADLSFIDYGKAVSEILLQTVQKLRPVGDEPKGQQVPPREWHQFIILHDSYVLGEPNRDIMSRLYISEGTFNRTRRRALRSVTRVLDEMERTAQKSAT